MSRLRAGQACDGSFVSSDISRFQCERVREKERKRERERERKRKANEALRPPLMGEPLRRH